MGGNMYDGFRTERRRHKRLRINLSVLYSIRSPQFVRDLLGGRHFEAQTIDISEGGVAILTQHYLPTSTLIKMRMIIVESDSSGTIKFYNPLSVYGEVRSVIQSLDNEYRVGLCFQKVDKIKQEKLQDILKSPLRPSFIQNN